MKIFFIKKIKKIFTEVKSLFVANDIFLKHILKKYIWVFPFQIILTFLSGFSNVVYSISTRNFLNEILSGKSVSVAFFNIILLIIYIIVLNIFIHITKIYSSIAFSKINIIVKKNMSNMVANLRASYFDIPENINILNRAIKYRENGGEQLLNYFFGLLTEFVAIASLMSILYPFAWWIIFFLIGLSLFRTWVESIITKKNYIFNKKRTLLNRLINYYNGIILNNAKLIELGIFNGKTFICKKYEDKKNESIQLNKTHNIVIGIFSIINSCTVIIQYFVLYAYIGIKLFNKEINVADFTLFFTAVSQFNNILGGLRKNVSRFIPMVLEAQNYQEFVENSKSYVFLDNSNEKININEIQTVEFKNVSFKYPQKEEYILQNVSFLIKRGNMVSIVGTNGSGKSTIIKLLLGIYTPTSGDILINSIPVDKINITSLWSEYSVMFQNNDILSLTAYENITFDETKLNEISNLIDEVGLSKRFKKEVSGIHTQLTRSFDKEGTELSGGEKQKIVFARVLHKQANMIILDEPSSALDVESEHLFFNFLTKIHQDTDKIILFISHNLLNSILATNIVFLSEGRVIAQGNHSELMKKCGEYKKLFELQANDYINN